MEQKEGCITELNKILDVTLQRDSSSSTVSLYTQAKRLDILYKLILFINHYSFISKQQIFEYFLGAALSYSEALLLESYQKEFKLSEELLLSYKKTFSELGNSEAIFGEITTVIDNFATTESKEELARDTQSRCELGLPNSLSSNEF